MLSYKLAYGSSWYLLPISVVELMDPLHILQSACINCPFTETLKQFHFCKFWLFLLLLYLWPPGSTNIFPTKTSSKKVIGPQDSDFIPSRQILVLLVSRNKSLHIAIQNELLPITCNIPTDKLPPTVSGMAVLRRCTSSLQKYNLNFIYIDYSREWAIG